MTERTRNYIGLLLLALILIGGFLLLALTGCRSKPDPAAALTAQRDAARDSLRACKGETLVNQGKTDYEKVRDNPASGWPDSAIERGLADPWRDLHAPGTSR